MHDNLCSLKQSPISKLTVLSILSYVIYKDFLVQCFGSVDNVQQGSYGISFQSWHCPLLMSTFLKQLNMYEVIHHDLKHLLVSFSNVCV